MVTWMFGRTARCCESDRMRSAGQTPALTQVPESAHNNVYVNYTHFVAGKPGRRALSEVGDLSTCAPVRARGAGATSVDGGLILCRPSSPRRRSLGSTSVVCF